MRDDLDARVAWASLTSPDLSSPRGKRSLWRTRCLIGWKMFQSIACQVNCKKFTVLSWDGTT